MKLLAVILSLFLSALSLQAQLRNSSASSQGSVAPPHFESVNGIKRLVVKDKPFLVLGGELFNSSSSSLAYMDPIWPGLVQLNLNTVLAGVSWELVEPEEGKFNFDLVDGLIENAHKHNLKIVFLWFASWKNMVSTYVPGWVKNNRERFPLLIAKNGEPYQVLSTFSDENVKADARAFAALMKHIKEVDAAEQTVIMMQVENEVGTNGGDRDHSEIATKAFNSQVPENLISYLEKNKSSLIPELKQLWAENGYRTKGNWSDIFGEGGATNEIFMAWQLGSYIGKVIEAGKEAYAIPMFVNAAIGRQDEKLGSYPSGGPLPFVMDVWRAAAPKLDMICPDIYFGDFLGHCRKYTQSGNPLFIPETGAGERGAANALQAFVNFKAIGFSPFGIDSRMGSSTGDNPFAQAYGVLNQLSPFILNSEPKRQMVAILPDSANSFVELGAYRIDCFPQRSRMAGSSPSMSYAVLIEEKPGEYIIAAKSVVMHFSLKNRKEEVTGILSAEEGRFENEKWIPGRRLNGDEIMVDYDLSKMYKSGKSGNGLKFGSSMTIQRVKLYNY